MLAPVIRTVFPSSRVIDIHAPPAEYFLDRETKWICFYLSTIKRLSQSCLCWRGWQWHIVEVHTWAAVTTPFSISFPIPTTLGIGRHLGGILRLQNRDTGVQLFYFDSKVDYYYYYYYIWLLLIVQHATLLLLNMQDHFLATTIKRQIVRLSHATKPGSVSPNNNGYKYNSAHARNAVVHNHVMKYCSALLYSTSLPKELHYHLLILTYKPCSIYSTKQQQMNVIFEKCGCLHYGKKIVLI